MRTRRQGEVLVGAALACGLFVAMISAYAGPVAGRDAGVVLIALFDRVDGLRVGAPVLISGIAVGRVGGLELTDDFRVRAHLVVEPGILVPADSAAAIRSDGLFGSRHVALEPGGAETMLESGQSIDQTQGALVIDALLDRVIARGRARLDEEGRSVN